MNRGFLRGKFNYKLSLGQKLFYQLPHEIIFVLNKTFRKKHYKILQKKRFELVSQDEYSLVGFDENKCIFVHIPKAGGVSINKALFGNLGGGHVPIYKYYLSFSPKEFEGYYKFSFVRNPWDRLVSAYFFLKSGGFNDSDKHFFVENLSKYKTFNDFVIGWLNEENIYSWIHFVPQYEFIMLNSKVLVDKIFKVEKMDNNMLILSSKLNRNLDIYHENKTIRRNKNYKDYYNDKTIEIVRKIYNKDIKMFQYEF